ncbi:histone deacetylase family protein [Stylonychia lemnae]|uniref:histone deacetylase n=1 Tax=Stylonychia lemnae TaxID=5949 RepID=A0A078AQS0_STYLE|nr:histone deacetylase family protein [Stylonychia lemnae]|eukprot:CDW84780.1 histone deacetylase family protein [Stylonychia lemnae]
MTHQQKLIDEVNNSVFNQRKLKKGDKIMKSEREIHNLDPDVYANKYSKECAYLAAGATVEACRAVFSPDKQVDSAFACVRPPGHHATCNRAQGFCFFNNVAIASNYLISKLGFKKICIFDWDIHCGDGTSQLFYENSSILYISIHKYNNGQFYPGKDGSPDLIGKDQGKGFNINFGFSASYTTQVGDEDYIYACSDLLFPIIQEYNPEAILISCGFDSAKGDPLGGINVTPIGYSWMTFGLMKICPNIVVVLEGGYNLKALAHCSESVIETLKLDRMKTELFNDYIKEAWRSDFDFDGLVENCKEQVCKEFIILNNYLKGLLRPFWKCLAIDSN